MVLNRAHFSKAYEERQVGFGLFELLNGINHGYVLELVLVQVLSKIPCWELGASVEGKE